MPELKTLRYVKKLASCDYMITENFEKISTGLTIPRKYFCIHFFETPCI